MRTFFWSFLYKIHFWLLFSNFKILAIFWRQLWSVNRAMIRTLRPHYHHLEFFWRFHCHWQERMCGSFEDSNWYQIFLFFFFFWRFHKRGWPLFQFTWSASLWISKVGRPSQKSPRKNTFINPVQSSVFGKSTSFIAIFRIFSSSWEKVVWICLIYLGCRHFFHGEKWLFSLLFVLKGLVGNFCIFSVGTYHLWVHKIYHTHRKWKCLFLTIARHDALKKACLINAYSHKVPFYHKTCLTLTFYVFRLINFTCAFLSLA